MQGAVRENAAMVTADVVRLDADIWRPPGLVCVARRHGAFPAFSVNGGTGKPPAEEHLIDQRIITIFLAHGAGSATTLHLPIVS